MLRSSRSFSSIQPGRGVLHVPNGGVRGGTKTGGGMHGRPFYSREIRGRSKNISLVYDTTVDDTDDVNTDEVEDLYCLLKQIQSECPDIKAVSSGAILSTYQRTRIENVCSRLNLTSLSYLWRMSSQRTLLNSILDEGQIDAVLVRVACPPGLMPNIHLGKSLLELRNRGCWIN